jgi:uncharacterized membrane protein YccC
LVLVGAALDLDLESVALLGAALGAVVALVPDRTPVVRLGGFAVGAVAAFVGYVLRALLLPDTSAGRAVAAVVVLLLCVGVSAAARDRLPLWSLLLGTAGLVGAYELTYAAAPPELLTTAVDTITALALSLAIGFFAGALAAPFTLRSGSAPVADERDHHLSDPRADSTLAAEERDSHTQDGYSDHVRLNDMMETSK